MCGSNGRAGACMCTRFPSGQEKHGQPRKKNNCHRQPDSSERRNFLPKVLPEAPGCSTSLNTRSLAHRVGSSCFEDVVQGLAGSAAKPGMPGEMPAASAASVASSQKSCSLLSFALPTVRAKLAACSTWPQAESDSCLVLSSSACRSKGTGSQDG